MINFSFNKLSIKKKLILTIMGISSATLLAILIALNANELFNLKKTLVEDLSTLADLVGKNSSGALMFFDKKAATENLLSLKAKPHVISAQLFDYQGDIFARYVRGFAEAETALPKKITSLINKRAQGYFYINDHVHLVNRIVFEEDQVLLGFIHIESDQEIYWERVSYHITTITIAICSALLLTLVFAYRAQKIFTDPILKLLSSMRYVSDENYSMTISTQRDDELGELIKGFNAMLSRLEKHDQLTKNYRRDLEEQVVERTLQLQKARDDALTASRTKSFFLANMSHEIRTPMNAILGFTQLLQHTALEKEQMSHLKIIDQSGKHLLTLINDILELSKIEAGSIESHLSDFDLIDLLNSVADMFRMRCEQNNIEWRMECFSDGPLYVNGDQGKLRQVLINIVGNACKFTHQGGILFRIAHVKKHRYQFTVQDSGIGIEETALARIFEAFHQEKEGEFRGGTGLGLNIAKRHIEIMSGNLQVTSTLNEGSTFFFDLELLPASESFTSNESLNRSNYRLKLDEPVLALVVDDVEENLNLLSKILNLIGFSVVCAENGQIALDEIENNFPDVVFMDIRMPVMDGVEAIIEIRKKYTSNQLKCIAVSASSMRHQSDFFIAKGYDLFISKPFRVDTIYEAITNILGLELIQDDHNMVEIEENSSATVDIPLLILEKEFGQELMQAAEFGQLTELSSLLVRLNKCGQSGEIAANHLGLLIKKVDLNNIRKYVEEIVND